MSISERGSQERRTQLQDVMRVTILALDEMRNRSFSSRQTVDMDENRILRSDWVDGLSKRLSDQSSRAGVGVEAVWVPTYADASLAFAPNRIFFSEFMFNLGSILNHGNLGDFVAIRNIKSIREGQLENPREDEVVRVLDSASGLKFLATRTKIDGLQILLDGSAITRPNSRDRTVRPILLISRPLLDAAFSA